jgi:hypothetical protein
MADLAFIQKSRIGRKFFLLKDDSIEVTLTFRGKRQQERIMLRTVNDDYERIARYFRSLVVVPLVLSGFCFWIVYVILGQDRLPHEFGLYPGIFALSFLLAAIKGVPKVDTFQFYNHWERPIFYIVRERNQAEECDAFVGELLHRIECAEKGVQLRGEEQANSYAQLTPGSLGLLLVGEYRWKTSIVLGALSAGLPWLTQITHRFDDYLFMLIFGATVGGVSFCVLSIQSKERFRFLSLAGAALALIAPLFYR